jgi:hypothetical protein
MSIQEILYACVLILIYSEREDARMPVSHEDMISSGVLPLLHVVRDALALHGYTMTDEVAALLASDTELLAVLQRLSFAALVPHHASQSQRLNSEM